MRRMAREHEEAEERQENKRGELIQSEAVNET